MDKGYFVYIIKRLNEHFKIKGRFVLVHVEIVENRHKAREMEKFFKTGFGREIRNEFMVAVAQLV